MYRADWHSSNAVRACFESVPGYWPQYIFMDFLSPSFRISASMRPRPLPKPFHFTIRLSSIRAGIAHLLQRRAAVWTAVCIGPIQWVKLSGGEADHRIKNTWIYTSRSPYAFMTWCLIKNKDDFTECLSKLPARKHYEVVNKLTRLPELLLI
jgi:hypothetical protein